MAEHGRTYNHISCVRVSMGDAKINRGRRVRERRQGRRRRRRRGTRGG